MRHEIITLIDKLQSASIPHEVTKHWASGLQVWYPSQKECVCDAICHQYSYGHERGLLEIMGLLTDEEREADSGDDCAVVGYLTANDVFARIYTHYINHG